MHKLLYIVLALACISLSIGASAQTAAPTQPSAQSATQNAPSVANTQKAAAPEQIKASKKGKKKKLKKKKARHAKAKS
jgi:Ni/Co efflux regulator RcnB